MQSPSHYRDTRLMDLLIDRQVPFADGNVIKYVFRWREKDGLKDLRKAADYLHALIAHEELKQMGYTGTQLPTEALQTTNSQED